MIKMWLGEILRGKTFGRAALNVCISLCMSDASGRWLDLGAGGKPSYARFLPSSFQRVSTDVKEHEGGVMVDANGPLPFTDHTFDGSMAINMLYITEDPASVLRELRRVVKPGGRFLATFPFFFLETPEPHDYHRWTREGVEQILRCSGWQNVSVMPVGGVGTVFGTGLLPFRGNRVVRLLFSPVVLLWDRVVPKNRCTFLWLATAENPRNEP
jgi:SAM-dependent methyltransferase